jgi:hypothetical protein
MLTKHGRELAIHMFKNCIKHKQSQKIMTLSSAREKVLGKEGFADVLFVEPSLPSVTLGKAFAECFGHSAKRPFPVVLTWTTYSIYIIVLGCDLVCLQKVDGL